MPSYSSPRWSNEIADCSMPMTFDTYSRCSYRCAYCFSVYQKSIGVAKKNWESGAVLSVNVEAVKRMFLEPDSSQFGPYIKKRLAMHWGGLSDPFDEYERRRGVTRELLRFFREIEYPICFSTKAAWWVYDKRYRDIFEGFPWFNVKFSIITTDAAVAARVEAGCPTPQERFAAMSEASKFVGGGVTLRLRPYIIGISDKTVGELISSAAASGAGAVSTEFFCLESRNPSGILRNYPQISRACGFDVVKFYSKYTRGARYMRLNRNIKRPYVDEMEALCEQHGLRFYVSDAHFKERCLNGSCCGLSEDWNYSRGQFCQALMIAKRDGSVRWSDISDGLNYAKTFLWRSANGYNTYSAEARARFYTHTMYDYLRGLWNHPDMGASPYKAFDGILVPSPTLDENRDVVYLYNREAE
jgi:DNA repair photolyase